MPINKLSVFGYLVMIKIDEILTFK